MKKSKLTAAQKKVLDRLSDGKWHNGHELGIDLFRLNALVFANILEIRFGIGESVHYRLKKGVENETNNH